MKYEVAYLENEGVYGAVLQIWPEFALIQYVLEGIEYQVYVESDDYTLIEDGM